MTLIDASSFVPLAAIELAGVSVYIWAVFVGAVFFFLALDLGIFHRQAHEVRMREALAWTGIWITLSILFGISLYLFWDKMQTGSEYSNGEAAMAFLAGYLVEWSLSVDNIFVFLVVFAYFHVPSKYQHRVLFWGILGALLFRSIFIAVGAVVLKKFLWTMVLFGLFLIFTGVKLVSAHGKTIDPGKNPVVKLFRRFLPVTDDYRGQKFLVRENGKLFATPLLVALVVVEFTDILFAVDSVPAIFAITHEPFLVFTSNVFAILGLRSLFFAVAGLMQLFRFLHYGLAVILTFVGIKMLYGYAAEVYHWQKFPVALSLGVIVGVLAGSIVISILKPEKAAEGPKTEEGGMEDANPRGH